MEMKSQGGTDEQTDLAKSQGGLAMWVKVKGPRGKNGGLRDTCSMIRRSLLSI